jgi:hypothetical protein
MNIISPIGASPVIKPVLPAFITHAARPAASTSESARENETASVEQTAPSEKSGIKWWSKGSFSFKDILDMINPLQHLPIVSTLYRAFTGEGIGGVARIVGAAIYGRAGGIGSMVSSLVNSVFGAVTGKDLGERVFAAVFGSPKSAATPAQASPPMTASVARETPSRRLVLSLAPVAEPSPAGRDIPTTYRQSPASATVASARKMADLKARSDAPVVVPGGLIFPERKVTKDMIAALDLYDRMAPSRARAWKKGDPDTENDSELESRRLNSTAVK